MLHRIAAVAFISAVVVGCQPAAPPPDPNLARLVDQQAIAQLIAGTYPNALDKGDFDTYAALYTEDGELTLQGNTVKGRAAIKQWKADASTKYQYTCEPFACERKDGKVVVTSRLTGNFPGSPVNLRFFFALEGDKIASLEIIP